MHPKKSLGQHWLFDTPTLKTVVKAGEVSPEDTVLEIGPGLGTLTSLLATAAKKVVAVELDERLVAGLSDLSISNLEVVQADIMKYDLSQLPAGYKVVANIPYYLTAHLIKRLLVDENPPSVMSLLVQKEVAMRITAIPGAMSVLAFSVQYYAEPRLVSEVPKELFKPEPRVDSAVIQIKMRSRPVFKADPKALFRIVKSGFSSRRKQLKNSLSAGLHIDGAVVMSGLKAAGIDPSLRAQALSLADWEKLYRQFSSLIKLQNK